jgi:ABC transport system ATP-binding/permease protein
MAKIVMSDPSGREKVYTLTSEPQVWGRGEDSNVILGSRSVSRHHMRLWGEGDKVMVEDLTGGKGILLDGEKASGTFELPPGLEMEAGVFLFRVHGVKLHTEVEGEVLGEEKPVPVLVGTRGAVKGIEIELQEGDNDVGRDPSLYVTIDENSISRLHARLTISQDGTGAASLVDMHSSNGTFVNKKKIDEIELHSGDIIRFGSVEFKFLLGKETSAAAAAMRKKKLLLIGVGGLIGLFVIIGVCAKLKGGHEQAGPTGPVVEEVPLEIRVEQHLKAAQGAMERFDWKTAKKEVETAKDLLPISREARKLEKKIQKEMVNKGLYQEGVSLYDLSKWNASLEAFKKIPENSAYYAKVKYKITDIVEKQSKYHLGEGKGYYRAQQYRKAHQNFIAYMQLKPCDKKVYERWLKKTEGRMRHFEIRYKPFNYHCTDEAKEKKSSIEAGLDPQDLLKAKYPNKSVFEAVELYFKGKAELSINKLRRIKVMSNNKEIVEQARLLERVMMVVSGKYSEGTGLLLQGELKKAQDKFHTVLENDKKIMPSGVRSFYRNNVGSQLASKMYKQGLEQYNRKEWVKSFNFWKECLDVSPDDRNCMQGLINLESVAEEALEYARQLESRKDEDAFDVWKQVMHMTRPESLPYKKANLKLREYE